MRIAAVIMLVPFVMFATMTALHAVRTRGWSTARAGVTAAAETLHYTFRDADGLEHTLPYVGDQAAAGRTVRIRYDPSDPTRSEIPIERAGTLVLFAFTGIVFLGGVLLLLGVVA